MAELFGFTIQRSTKDSGGERTFSTPTPDDGTIDVAGGGFFGQVLDTDGRERSDLDLIRRYRDIAQQAECDTAIEDIVNEGIVSNQNDQAVEISLDRLRYPDKIKRKIRAEFNEVLRLLHFGIPANLRSSHWIASTGLTVRCGISICMTSTFSNVSTSIFWTLLA